MGVSEWDILLNAFFATNHMLSFSGSYFNQSGEFE